MGLPGNVAWLSLYLLALGSHRPCSGSIRAPFAKENRILRTSNTDRMIHPSHANARRAERRRHAPNCWQNPRFPQMDDATAEPMSQNSQRAPNPIISSRKSVTGRSSILLWITKIMYIHQPIVIKVVNISSAMTGS